MLCRVNVFIIFIRRFALGRIRITDLFMLNVFEFHSSVPCSLSVALYTLLTLSSLCSLHLPLLTLTLSLSLSVCVYIACDCQRNCPNIAATHGRRVQGIAGGRGIVLLAIIELNSKIWAIDLQAFAIRGDTTIKLTMAKHARICCKGGEGKRDRERDYYGGMLWHNMKWNHLKWRKKIDNIARKRHDTRQAPVCEGSSSSKCSRVSFSVTATCRAALALGLRQLQLHSAHLKATVTTVRQNCKCTRWQQLQHLAWLTLLLPGQVQCPSSPLPPSLHVANKAI